MTVKYFTIDIREGERVTLLLTPALYGVGKARGIDLASDLKSEDKSAVTKAYAKLAYCAAINAWEVNGVDDPNAGDFPYRYADFDRWAWEHQDELLKFIDAVLIAFTGKGLKEHASQTVKKKTMK